jgi:subfamily B ATP-binding cassette protein HlyB/CyaB
MDKTPPAPLPDCGSPASDSGLAALVLVARLHGLPADPDTLAHRHGSGGRPLDGAALVRAARDTGLRARPRAGADADLDTLPLPALAGTHAGGWRVLARVSTERVLVQEPGAAQPRIMARAEFLAAWSGRVLLLARRGAGAASTRFGIGWFLRAARPYRRILAEVLLGSAVLQVLGLATPVFFQVVVDKVLVHKVLGTLQVLVAGFVVVSVFEVLLGGLRTWLLAHTTNRIDVTLGARLFAHLLALPLRYFEVRRVGEIAARVRELETLRAFVTGSALTLLIDLGFTVIAFALMYHYSPLLCAVVALSLPLYLLLSLVAAPLLRAQVEEKFRLGAENQSFLVESLAGMHTLKAMALEPPMQRRWEEQLAGYVSAAYRATLTANWSAQAANLVSRLVSAGLLWFGAGAVIAGTLSVGELIAFNMLAMRSGAPVLRLFQLWQDFQQARVSLARLGDILNSPGETRAQASRAALPALAGAIRFERVSFRYEPERAHALCELDLAIAPGEVIGIVGRSGSGKSTLARLVQRLYVPEQGRILIDGCDIALAAPDALRRQIGVVPQECFLFSGSVRENIALGDPGMPLERVMHAARLAGAHEFIVELPYGYDTPLGEHAHNLSGGQRQRLAIARALVRDPRILVFDEATSALDYESESVVRANLEAICAGRTVIIIAHRLSALARCQRILVLDRGRLVEQGTPSALLASGGLFARLHALQSPARAA